MNQDRDILNSIIKIEVVYLFNTEIQIEWQKCGDTHALSA